MQQLPEKQRRALVAVYYEGRNFPDAAKATGIPLGSLKRYVRQALEAIRKELGADWEAIR